MKIASTKNEKPSSAKPSPKTLANAAMKPGHSKPNSKLRMVPVTTPTANSAIMIFDQRLASVRKSGSPEVKYRHSAKSTIAGKAIPNALCSVHASPMAAFGPREASRSDHGWVHTSKLLRRHDTHHVPVRIQNCHRRDGVVARRKSQGLRRRVHASYLLVSQLLL